MTAPIFRAGSAKELTMYASEDLQNDVSRERDLEFFEKKDKKLQARKRAICQANEIPGPEYWRGLRFGWRYIECFVEALQLSEFETKRLRKVLEAAISGLNEKWASYQVFESDLGNDDPEAFRVLKDIVSKIISTRQVRN